MVVIWCHNRDCFYYTPLACIDELGVFLANTTVICNVLHSYYDVKGEEYLSLPQIFYSNHGQLLLELYIK